MARPSNSYTGGNSGGSRRRSGPARGSRGAGAGRLLLGIVLGVVSAAAGMVLYFYFGSPPVAVTDKAPLWEHLTETVAVQRRIAAEAKQPPFPANEDAFEGAARTYHAQCAQCHGTPDREAPMGRAMLPHAQQFFGRNRRTAPPKPAGELFWPTAFGIRRSGMPAYNRTLTNTQLWQLALLLHSADQDLPDPVMQLLADAPAARPTTAAPVH